MINVDTVNEYLKEKGFPINQGFVLKIPNKKKNQVISVWDLDIPMPKKSDLAKYVKTVKDRDDFQNWERQLDIVQFNSQDIENIIDALEDNVREGIHGDTLDKYNTIKQLRSERPL